MIITRLLQLVNQIRILHWQTTAYSQHVAFGKIYDDLSDLIDEYVEIFIGKYGMIKNKDGFNLKLSDIENINTNSFLDEYCDFLTSEFVENLDETKDSDLLNIRDEILALLNKLKYLLTLK